MSAVSKMRFSQQCSRFKSYRMLHYVHDTWTVDPKDRGTMLFQNVTVYQLTWHNIPKDLNQVSSRLSNFTITFNIETCEQNKQTNKNHSSSSGNYALPPNTPFI